MKRKQSGDLYSSIRHVVCKKGDRITGPRPPRPYAQPRDGADRAGARRFRMTDRDRNAVSPARAEALRTLLMVASEPTTPADELQSSSMAQLTSRDRALAQEIVYGVLRFQRRLDYILDHHTRRPVNGLDPVVRIVLRIGLYQIKHLERVPDNAAVDESVRMMRQSSEAPVSFVNAVLRSICRRPRHPPLPDRSNPLRYLTMTASLPDWIARRWLERLGEAAAFERAEWFLERPRTYVSYLGPRALEDVQEELTEDGVDSEPVPGVPGCLGLATGSSAALAQTRLFESSELYIQDAGSQLIAQLVRPAAEQTILDACAAPGGKSRSIALRSEGAFLVASDRSFRRTRLVTEVGKLAKPDAHLVVADARRPPFTAAFDWILFDAPCSSLGTLARNPDIKWRLDEPDLVRLTALQRHGLKALAKQLRPGGTMVYATCSTEREENEDVVEWVLRKRGDLELIPASPLLGKDALRYVSTDGLIRVLPERDGFDGYFAAILRRREG